MGITAVAAVVGIGAAAATSVEIVAAVALTATVVGMVTKSPVLMKIGGGLGLAAAGAGLITAATAAPVAAEGAAGAAEGSAAASAADTAAATAAPAATAGGIETVTSTAPAVSGASTASDLASGASALGGASQNLASSSPVQAENAAPTPLKSLDTVNLQAPTIQAPSAPNIPALKDPTSFLDTIMNGIEDHRALATASAQLIGGGLSGLGTTYAADKQYAINKQLLGLQQQKAANANQQPGIIAQYNGSANLFPTTTPTYNGTQVSGIINQQRSGS